MPATEGGIVPLDDHDVEVALVPQSANDLLELHRLADQLTSDSYSSTLDSPLLRSREDERVAYLEVEVQRIRAAKATLDRALDPSIDQLVGLTAALVRGFDILEREFQSLNARCWREVTVRFQGRARHPHAEALAMILFWLRPGQATTREIILADVMARFPQAQHEMQLRASVAIDAAIENGTLIARDGRLEAVNPLRGWMLDLEVPPDDEPPPRTQRAY